MKLQYTEGCMCYSTTIDGKEIADIEDTSIIKEALHKMIDKIDDVGTLQMEFTSLMESLGEYTDLGHCEQCGDHITEFNLEIE